MNSVLSYKKYCCLCIFLIFLQIISFSSCKQETIGNSSVVYNDTTLHGRYNKAGFDIQLDSLPVHNKVQISFDLYIHDSWDGNSGGINGPDFWQMKVDSNLVIHTTFANRPCGGFNCGSQSYPANFPSNNYARTGEEPVQLSGACVLIGERGTSLYKISRIIRHTGPRLTLGFSDQLKQSNAADSYQQCDESWSIDNIQIKAIQIQ